MKSKLTYTLCIALSLLAGIAIGYERGAAHALDALRANQIAYAQGSIETFGDCIYFKNTVTVQDCYGSNILASVNKEG